MAWTLRSDMRLEPRRSDGYVALRGTDSPQADIVFRLHPYQGMALALFDGRRTTDEVVQIVDSVLRRSPEHARVLVGSLFSRYRQFLVDVESGAPIPLRPVDPAECLFPTSYNFHFIRDAAPAALRWVVTEHCDKKCRYCFMNAIHLERGLPPDMDLTFARVCELIAEAARVGVTKIILSGGEPFLRPDLVEIIGVLVAHQIDIVPITKYRITGDRMRQLGATGLKELHVSLDSHDPAMVAALTGIPDAFDQMIDTIRGAVEHGIDIVLRPVLAEPNVRDLPGLLALAEELGVKRILFSKYGQTCGRHEDALLLSRSSKEWLHDNWPRLRDRYRGLINLTFDVPAGEGRRDEGCVEGLRGLTFLPNGVASKCEHWRTDDQLVFGDLRHQSLMEVWNSDRLARVLFPGREAYTGTICYNCRNLPHCDYIRGRCSVSALMVQGTPYGPDVHCPIGAFEPVPRGATSGSPLLQIQGLKSSQAAVAAHASGAA